MALSRLIIIIIFLISLPVFGQEKFREICQNPLPYGVEIENDLKWLKYYFNTTECDEVIEELSKLKSFSDFMVPQSIQPKRYHRWSEDFPYLEGISNRMSLDFMPSSKLGFYPDETNIFVKPELYAEFTNLNVLDLDIPYNFVIRDICRIKQILPNVSTLVVSIGQAFTIAKQCKDLSVIPWLIVTDMHGKNLSKLHSKIIGIYAFAGSLENLKKFRFLRYLGINNNTTDNDIGFLGKNLNLTHLTLNMRHGVKNISEIRQLKNLKSLTITCTIARTYDSLNILEGMPCENSYLTDLSFLTDLPWLEKLVLSSNRLVDVSVVEKLTNLKHLDLSKNDITVMPDLSAHKNLKHFNIDANPVSR